ncbi:replicative DNA helicase [Silanimonas lenta]|uniref:replicative DNA helicase n=1 Tax=Silanimonas lenta TaxID=265429 RepID=UPI00042720AF|nr:replicative DNA helicase [Silanimonas lenta]
MAARLPSRPVDPRVEALRVPPHSIDAEQAVLGALMLDPQALEKVVGVLSHTDFYRRDHQLIFKAISELAEKNRPYDAVTLGEWFEAHALADQVGGTAYLVELAQTTPSAANVRAYADIVRDKSVLRSLIEVGTQIAEDGFAPGDRETPELLAEAEQRVFRIADQNRTGRKDIIPLKEAMKEAFEILQVRYETQGTVTGLPTGFHDFDEMTAGLQPSDLIVLAARPAMGKTTLALNMAEYAALKSKKAVVVFSMEMSASQLAFRLISSIGRINAGRLKTGQLEDEDWSRVTMAMRLLSESKIFIDDEPALSPAKLMSKARRIKREHDLGLVVVDYLQLMQVPGNSENRATEISEISRSLKAMAKELNVPVIALSQLNRGLESRTDKRPVMSDLRESGAIEQDADIILFIYRDEYYHKDSPDKGLAEVIISKHRNGATGTVKLKFFGEYTRFDNLARDAEGRFE